MSDYMKEAERLLAKHEQAAGLCRYADCQTTRAALLAHIQRGAVPEGVGAFRHKETGQVRYTLIGGEHDEDEWEDVLIVPMLAAAPAPDHFRGVTKMVPAPAEVPMPEPDTHCYDEDERRDVWSHSADQMRTYGDACRAAGEAAGYARGLAEAGRDAERYRTVRFLATAERDPLPEYAGDTSSPDAFDASIDHATAALRGEVKP